MTFLGGAYIDRSIKRRWGEVTSLLCASKGGRLLGAIFSLSLDSSLLNPLLWFFFKHVLLQTHFIGIHASKVVFIEQYVMVNDLFRCFLVDQFVRLHIQVISYKTHLMVFKSSFVVGMGLWM